MDDAAFSGEDLPPPTPPLMPKKGSLACSVGEVTVVAG
jgi:hypothetical protein